MPASTIKSAQTESEHYQKALPNPRSMHFFAHLHCKKVQKVHTARAWRPKKFSNFWKNFWKIFQKYQKCQIATDAGRNAILGPQKVDFSA